eukprot:TRINITY_DN40321_c0_g1_i1.p1 TRINITY_DN40321_c0_g1~~TRINITY_DN40321_c0_g1_i1.p1  ORF type:complete len:322 (+),score=113.71 TRINITY_DN40321_c0_g1_i1:74-967(+)
MSLPQCTVGFCGGTGVYKMEGLDELRELDIDTPFGKPSLIMVGKLDGQNVAFCARHGEGHRLLPFEIPFRANIFALKMLGVKYLFSVSACGSFKEEMAPGHFVVVDQFIDKTYKREATFFGQGVVGHVAFGEPTCKEFGKLVTECLAKALPDVKAHTGGATYICMEGPAFSTRAESVLHKNEYKADVIGMTAATEAKLAREAEMAYALVGMVTDYDAWHEEIVDVSMVFKILGQNAANAQVLVKEVLRTVAAKPFESVAHTALDVGCMTRDSAEKRAPVADDHRKAMQPLFGRFIPA